MKLMTTKPLMCSAAVAVLAAAPLASAAPVSYFNRTGVQSLGNPQANWNANHTTKSVAFELTFDFTAAVDAITAPIVLWEAGATGNGAALVLHNDVMHFFAGNGADDVTSGNHGLTALADDVQVLTVYEISGGAANDDEKLSLYVNGVLISSADRATSNAWAGSDAGGLGQEDGGARTRYVGTGLFDDGTIVNFPNDGTDLSFSAYLLASAGGNADNTIANILVPEPSSLALLGLGGLLVARRRR